MTTLGKYIGGGMSFGAFGGKREIMELFDPTKPDSLPHAGTFNNNVLTMAAGVAGYGEVYTPAAAEELNARGEKIRDRLNAICREAGVAFQFSGIGSMMTAHATTRPIKTAADIAIVATRTPRSCSISTWWRPASGSPGAASWRSTS